MLLTLEELAEQLKVHKSWLYSKTRLRGEGQIPQVKVGKYYRFRFEEVEKWLKKKYQTNDKD
jgi:DNA binding domain, excisionase family